MWNLIALGMAIVLTLILVAGVLTYSQGSNQQGQAARTIAAIDQIVTQADSIYQGYPSGYATLSTQGLINDGVIPGSMVQAGSATGAVDVWGGQFAVDPTNQMTGLPDAFTVWIHNVPMQACTILLTRMEGGVQGGTGGLSVNGQIPTLPINPAELGTLCNSPTHNLIGLAFS